MIERDLQAYLFANPDVLFPGQQVQEKRRELYIDGRRIDLAFRVDGVRYIVELKAVPLKREHVGQVVEYYGAMRKSFNEDGIKMVLVAPAIHEYRRVFLEELGIRCVEMPTVPSGPTEADRLRDASSAHHKADQIRSGVSSSISDFASASFEELITNITQRSLAISRRFLKDSLEPIRRIFEEYDVRPVKMTAASSPDVLCSSGLPSEAASRFSRGGVWWAYAFGTSEVAAKNNVPNISVCGMQRSLDVALNAELRTSQTVVRKRIAAAPSRFNSVIAAHGQLEFQAWLKLEHQPRFYHWIPVVLQRSGNWNAHYILDICQQFEADFLQIREAWISYIREHRSELSEKQFTHMHQRNKRLNLALRLARPFEKEDQFWRMDYSEQCEMLICECRKLKPLIDFFQ